MTFLFDIFYNKNHKLFLKGVDTVNKIDQNKQQKRDSLLESAFSLFINNGFSKTSISDIANHAGVAKGTFYLYFKDKYDIRNHLIAHKAGQIVDAAYVELQTHPELTDFEDQILFMTDHILNQFADNHNLVLLLSKHLSWGFVRNSLIYTSDKDTPSILTIFESMLEKANYTYHTPELMMYMILEIVGGASYNAILYGQPVSLKELKPHLYKTVKDIFKQYRVENI